MARAAPTMPGSVATFCSCSSDRSLRIACSRSSSAKTRAGTRMSARASRGISQTASSTRRSSDIEHDPCQPAVCALREREPVVGHGLDQWRRRSYVAFDDRVLRHEVDVRNALRHETLRVSQENELLEELDELCPSVVRREGDGVAQGLAGPV